MYRLEYLVAHSCDEELWAAVVRNDGDVETIAEHPWLSTVAAERDSLKAVHPDTTYRIITVIV